MPLKVNHTAVKLKMRHTKHNRAEHAAEQNVLTAHEAPRCINNKQNKESNLLTGREKKTIIIMHQE